MESKASEKTQSYSTTRETSAGMHGRQAFHLPAGLLQAPQSAGGGTSHTNGDDRGSSALCSEGVRVLSRPALLLTATRSWLSEDPSPVMCKEHCSSCLHSAPRLGWRSSLSKDSKRTGTVHFDSPKMNSSSCNITAYEIFSFVQLCVYIPVMVLGIVLNVLALWVFCGKLGQWTETRVYMVNLAVADCLLLFTLPFKILSQFQQLKVDGWCLVLEGGYFINRFMSIGIITSIAADRYLAIKYPLRSKALRSPLKAAFASGFLWIVIICGTSLIKSFEDRREDDFCFEKSSATPSVITLCATVIGFFIPLLILSYCSIQTIAELRRRKNETCHSEKLTRKASYIVSANVAVFIICFLPLYLGHLLRFVLDSSSSNCSAIQSINDFVHFASILANTNCCLDAICYYFVNKEFKEASSKLAKSKSEGSEEAEI